MVYGARGKIESSIDNFTWLFLLHLEMVRNFEEAFLKKHPGKLQPLGDDDPHDSTAGSQDQSGYVRGCKKTGKYSLGG